jgi:hypothetical protein
MMTRDRNRNRSIPNTLTLTTTRLIGPIRSAKFPGMEIRTDYDYDYEQEHEHEEHYP